MAWFGYAAYIEHRLLTYELSRSAEISRYVYDESLPRNVANRELELARAIYEAHTNEEVFERIRTRIDESSQGLKMAIYMLLCRYWSSPIVAYFVVGDRRVSQAGA